MVLGLAALLVCTSMLLIYAILCAAERDLKRREQGTSPLGPRSKNN
jgi:hypothetical protein